MLYYFWESNYIQPLHNQDAHSRSKCLDSKYIKLGGIHIGTMNHITPMVWVVLQSVDYAATHVGKKYPSP
jgi:hypothetical protein